MAEGLTSNQCVLLTVHYASQANIQALHSFTPSRLDALDPELVLRILLTYLPETVEPKLYTSYVGEVGSRLYLDHEREDIEVDIAPVKDIGAVRAQKEIEGLNLLEIIPPNFPPHAPEDVLTRFLCHRSYRIDNETGALNLVQQLITPFLERNDFLLKWYIGVVLPVVRLNLEYYPQEETALTLADFEQVNGEEGIEFLLSKIPLTKAQQVGSSNEEQIGILTRDIKGLVGPWMYGHTERKRRKLDRSKQEADSDDEMVSGLRKINLSGVSKSDRTGHDWEYVYKWTVHRAATQFTMVTQLIEEWDGPSDIDLGGYARGNAYLNSEVQQKLEAQYAQAAFASCYAVQADTDATIRGAHAILARLAELLDFVPPPDLASSVDSLPKVERHATELEMSSTVKDISPAALLAPEHPLTTPRLETYMLLQMMVYSAYQFAGLGHSISIVSVAKLHFYSTSDDQLVVLRDILRHLSESGRRDESHWKGDRAKLMWLWSWGIKPEDTDTVTGSGVLGKINRDNFEAEMMKAFVTTSCYPSAIALISPNGALGQAQAESIVYASIMEAYDSASNGNKTRGSMKKASDILTAFRKQFPSSQKLNEALALIAATHALSFYSLTLQHGVPFQPVNIRVSKDPIELLSKVLEQNPRSFTQLDDLIGVANNFVSAGLITSEDEDEDDGLQDLPSEARLESQRRAVARRVTFIAVEAALREDDFETAYSYIMNRLTPANVTEARTHPRHNRNISTNSTASRAAPVEDDTSWRAAYLAGRYRPSTASPPSLRRLEQRTELLSLALLLAPTTSLTDILSAWRRCEEETTALQVAQQQAEHEFDDRADRREPSALPGDFSLAGDQPQMILNQQRREMGRLAGSRPDGDADTPLSMFDLTRNAARALSRNVNLSQVSRQSSDATREGSIDLQRPSNAEDDAQLPTRRRDLVANAVSGGLANGIGWVLGAKPAVQQKQ